MESKFQTSFIPKSNLNDSGKVKVKTPINLLFIISMILIIAALAGAAAIFGYQYYLDRQIAAKSEELAQKERTFPYEEVEEIARVDNKLRASETLIAQHIALTPFFELLEEATLINLRFDSFAFTYFSPERISLTMNGEARSFEAVARQAELFASDAVKNSLKEPVFSDLNVEEGGNVTFSFLAAIDPALIDYESQLTTAPVSAPVVPASVSTSASSTVATSTNLQSQ